MSTIPEGMINMADMALSTRLNRKELIGIGTVIGAVVAVIGYKAYGIHQQKLQAERTGYSLGETPGNLGG